MVLKHIVNATEFATLADAIKAEYKVKTDGNYHLDLGGMFVTDKDPQGLLSALNNERQEHATTKTKFDAITKERDDAKQAAALAEAQKAGNYKEVEKLFAEKMEAIQTAYKKQVDEANERTAKQQAITAENLRTSEARKIAADLFGERAELFLPHVLNGLKAVPGDNPTVQIVKSDGTPDLSMDLERFKKSFLTNPMFAPMIVTSKASGGSANDGTGKNVPATRRKDGSPKTFKDFSPGEVLTIKKNDPDEYKRIMATANDFTS